MNRLIVVPLAALVVGCGPRGGPPQWHEAEGYRWAPLHVSGGKPGFTRLDSSDTGIDFVNDVSNEQALANEHVFNGSGVAAGDVDGDGLVDLYFARLNGPNALYRNLGGWRFQDVTGAAGVAADDRLSTGAVLADVDGDGDLDLLLTSMGGPVSLFVNDGHGVFADRTAQSGLVAGNYGTTLALADVDGDGDLDLYVADNKLKAVRDLFPPERIAFDSVVQRIGGTYRIRPEFRDHYRLIQSGDRIIRYEFAEPDHFYLNDGRGRFNEVSFTGGRFRDAEGRVLTETPRDWGLTARFFDIDGDGDPDLYVCNDFESPDRIWINDGTGRFRAMAYEAVRTTSNADMAMDFADVDRDGDVDLFEVDMLSRNSGAQKTQRPTALPDERPALGAIGPAQQVPRNVLLVNRGDGTFAEAAYAAGLEASGWSWSTMFVDVDLDGYEDLLIGNGHTHDFLDMDTRMRLRTLRADDWRNTKFLFPALALPNAAFRNRGGVRFEEVAAGWGFGPDSDVSNGGTLADLDGDGDLDVITNRLGWPAGVYRNDGGAPRVAVRLAGRAPNRFGVGGAVTVRGGAAPVQSREMTAGGLYTSSAEPVLVFATGGAEAVTIEVAWRSGAHSVLRDVAPNRLYEIREPAPGGAPPAPPTAAEAAPWFEDQSAVLHHRHVETPYDDFRRQPLLPKRLSQLGPGVSWIDVDRDGDPDLLVTSGAGGRLALYRNVGGHLVPGASPLRALGLDLTTVLGLPDRGSTLLLVGQSSYEAESGAAAATPAVLGVTLRGAARPMVGGGESSVGPLALADIDGDGDLDLFVGGRVNPGRYPEPATSRLFRNADGVFERDSVNAAALAAVGLVSAAVFSDVDGDGDPDLLLALEWGPIRLFRNDGGTFSDVSAAWGLREATGLWSGLATGDLDGDGRPDLVATNWGLNTAWRAGSERPLELFYGDFDRNGAMDPLLARFDPRIDDRVPLVGLGLMAEGLPYVARRFPSFHDYANATLADVVGPALADAGRLSVTTLAHTLFLNRGGRFEAVPLPFEAQLAPASFAAIADLDGDGFEDVFVDQNFFPTGPETQRQDGGRSLVLRGDGTGALVPVSGTASGITVYGDARGAALADYDGDGRLDLAVSENGNATKLYHNVSGRPGLTVRLVGPVANPDAVGAALRIVYSDTLGPLHEVQAGSGYWSENDVTPVLGLRAEPRAVWVRWPDGHETTTAVEAGATHVVVKQRTP